MDGQKAFETFKFANNDVYPCICILLRIGCVPGIGSSEVEHAASGIRHLKTPYCTTVSSWHESDLNLLQLKNVCEIDIDAVVERFVTMNSQRLYTKNSWY